MEENRNTLRLNKSAQKLIPKDLSENLGKLPPQAPEIEEVVLGALMLEKDAIERVANLKKEHFYLDKHSVVYQAIQSVVQSGAAPDARMVWRKLKEDGKIDLVGGPAYLAELTSKISSAANIEHHVRIVIELAMKRELIRIANRVHQVAYEDTSDVFDVLQLFQENLKFLEERETFDNGPEKTKALWDKLMITTKPDEIPPLITIDTTPVVSQNDHTLIVGKKKSRKSLFITYLLYLFLIRRDTKAEEVLIFDTEQGKSHVWKIVDRIYRMTNKKIPVFYLRGQTPEFRKEFIRNTVKHWHIPVKIIVIDGVLDLMYDINDNKETSETITWIEQMISEFNLAIINVLHLNKTDNNARGVIGTELLNKTIATIELQYDEKTGHSIVKCESCRDMSFDSFLFTHGPTGLPERIGVQIGNNAATQNEQLLILQKVFEDESLRYKELINSLTIHFSTETRSIGTSAAKKLLQRFLDRKWIIKSGKERDPNTRYKLVVRPGMIHQEPVQLPNPPPELFNSIPPPTEPPFEKSDDTPF